MFRLVDFMSGFVVIIISQAYKVQQITTGVVKGNSAATVHLVLLWNLVAFVVARWPWRCSITISIPADESLAGRQMLMFPLVDFTIESVIPQSPLNHKVAEQTTAGIVVKSSLAATVVHSV